MNRNKLSAVAAAAVAALSLGTLSACGSSSSGNANAASTGTVKVAVYPSFSSLGAYEAMADGAFKDAGLKVSFVTVNTPADVAPLLSSGQVQFGLMDMTTPVLAAAKASSAPFVFDAPATKGTPLTSDGWGTANVWVKKGSKITSVKDLQNSKFGIPQLNSQLWLDVRSNVDAAGGDSSKIQWVQIPDPTQNLTQIKSGQIDATTSAEPTGTGWAADPKVSHLAGFVSNEGHIAYSFASTKDFAAKNADVVDKFRTAIIDGNTAFNALDAAGKAKLAGTVNDKWPAELLSKARYSNFGVAAVSADDVQFSIDRMKKYQMLDASSSLKATDLLP
ncbi:ABC transporter substrate-binding protein [Nocardioides nematodiphilus]|uniref:ABC transporter substrate-binding protein n=1 Tax=Nocardioides nematodiphilus TaxID=2849669 RepID=UPI001CDA2833|nr:ABC transporter substrate-binding protein [Nocardioides nematodiphilus]MCA1983237.1 ABC transporter substrate-binding protein [Nocardioides nematodiphilus]